MKSKIGSIVVLGITAAVVGFCYKSGTYGATAVANKIYDKFGPPKEEPPRVGDMLADIISCCACPQCNEEREQSKSDDGEEGAEKNEVNTPPEGDPGDSVDRPNI